MRKALENMYNDPRYFLPAPGDPRQQGYQTDLQYWVQTIGQQATGWSLPPSYPIPRFPPPEYTVPYVPSLPPILDIVPVEGTYMQAPYLSYSPQIYGPMPWSTLPTEPVVGLQQSIQHTRPSPERSNTVWIVLLLLLALVVLPFAATSLSQDGPPHLITAPTQQRALTRINQWTVSQYNNGQYVYAASACSAAAMAEVINYYRDDKYRIADILTAAIDVNAISTELGLLNGYISIRNTVARFDAHYAETFTTTDMSGSSLDAIIATASSGKPVIVGWPPTPHTWWSGGHLLVVRGGDARNVQLADSSSYNTQTLSRATFLKRWGGFAVLIELK